VKKVIKIELNVTILCKKSNTIKSKENTPYLLETFTLVEGRGLIC
jgi:pseudouridine-5'-phosphate glycosidase